MNTTGQKNDKDNKEKRYSSFSITHFMPASSILKSCYVSSHFKLDWLVHDENVKAHTQTDV